MRKNVIINKKDLMDIGYQKAPIKQILNLNLSAEEQILLLNFFSNSESWKLSINSIAEESFYTTKNRNRIKKIIKKIIDMDYLKEDLTSYTVNLKSIQKDYNLNKLPDTVSTVTQGTVTESTGTDSITPPVTQSTNKHVTQSTTPTVTESTTPCYPESHKTGTQSTTNNNNKSIIEEKTNKTKNQFDKLKLDNSGSKDFEDSSSVDITPISSSFSVTPNVDIPKVSIPIVEVKNEQEYISKFLSKENQLKLVTYYLKVTNEFKINIRYIQLEKIIIQLLIDIYNTKDNTQLNSEFSTLDTFITKEDLIKQMEFIKSNIPYQEKLKNINNLIHLQISD